MTVHVFPDFIIYGDVYCTKCRLTFSNRCIKLEGSTVNGLKENINFEWDIGAITRIKSEWSGRVSYIDFSSLLLTYRPTSYLLGVG
jgi:sentrin-specific protease 7